MNRSITHYRVLDPMTQARAINPHRLERVLRDARADVLALHNALESLTLTAQRVAIERESPELAHSLQNALDRAVAELEGSE